MEVSQQEIRFVNAQTLKLNERISKLTSDLIVLETRNHIMDEDLKSLSASHKELEEDYKSLVGKYNHLLAQYEAFKKLNPKATLPGPIGPTGNLSPPGESINP